MAEPKLGKSYKCIKDVPGYDEESIQYIKGKVYKSEQKGCITSEGGNKAHYWDDSTHDEFGEPYPFTFSEVFKEIEERNRRS